MADRISCRRLLRITQASKKSSAGTPPTQQRRTAFERIRLAQRMRKGRNDGHFWAEISDAEGIPMRTAQDILAKFNDEVGHALDHRLVLEETALLLQEALNVLSRELDEGDSSSARVGAANSMRVFLKDRLNLLIQLGHVPENVGSRLIYESAQSMLLKAVSKVDQADVPQELKDDINELAPAGLTG